MQVFCYGLSPNDNTEWRKRTISESEHFLDVSSMTSDAIAKMINQNKIQILINLNGYTKVKMSSLAVSVNLIVSFLLFLVSFNNDA